MSEQAVQSGGLFVNNNDQEELWRKCQRITGFALTRRQASFLAWKNKSP